MKNHRFWSRLTAVLLAVLLLMEPLAALAEDFHMKESAVTMLLLRTRKKLKKYLEKEGYKL